MSNLNIFKEYCDSIKKDSSGYYETDDGDIINGDEVIRLYKDYGLHDRLKWYTDEYASQIEEDIRKYYNTKENIITKFLYPPDYMDINIDYLTEDIMNDKDLLKEALDVSDILEDDFEGSDGNIYTICRV